MFKALWRFFANILSRKTRRMNEAADNVYTGSTEGISDAFDDAQDALIKDYKQLEGAVAEVLMVSEQSKLRLEELNKQEETYIAGREGALRKAKKFPEDVTKHKAAFNDFQSKINTIEIEQENVEAQIELTESQLQELEMQLRAMQRELADLPREKAEQIAKYISSKKLTEAFDRINGLKTSYNRGPLEAIRKQNAKLSAQAQVKRRMAGVDAKRETADYVAEGRDASTEGLFESMLAQREADEADKTGAATEAATAERPEA